MYSKLNHILINFCQSHDRHHPLISFNPDLCLQGGEKVLAEAFDCTGMDEEVAEMLHRWADPGATILPDAINALPSRLPHPSRGPTAANRFAKDVYLNKKFLDYC